jgi:hypothetical protein
MRGRDHGDSWEIGWEHVAWGGLQFLGRPVQGWPPIKARTRANARVHYAGTRTPERMDALVIGEMEALNLLEPWRSMDLTEPPYPSGGDLSTAAPFQNETSVRNCRLISYLCLNQYPHPNPCHLMNVWLSLNKGFRRIAILIYLIIIANFIINIITKFPDDDLRRQSVREMNRDFSQIKSGASNSLISKIAQIRADKKNKRTRN